MIFHAASEWELIASEQPDAPALVHGELVRTWREFEQRAARLATACVEGGLAPGDRVAIELYNCPEFLETYFAVLKARCVPVAVNYRYLDDELRHILEDCDAAAIVFHASFGERIARVAREVHGLRLMIEVDDVRAQHTAPGARRYADVLASHAPAPPIVRDPTDPTLWYTGGTTGQPKGVSGTVWHRGINPLLRLIFSAPGDGSDLSTIRKELLDNGNQPVVVPCSPLMHSTAMAMVSEPALHLGGTVVTLTSRSFDADALLDTVELRGATHLALTGDPIARPIIDALNRRAAAGKPCDTTSLRVIASAGVAWGADVKDALFEHIPQVMLYDACGSTEGATYGFSVLHVGDPTSTARFTTAPGVIVVDEHTGKPLGYDQRGLLASPSTRSGYYKDSAKSAEVFRTIGGVPYTVPGDFGACHADGTVTLLGRESSTINSGGEKVFAEEVEQVIVAIPGVTDCAVVGVADERWTQRVTALVELADPSAVTEAVVITKVREHLAAYKAPKQVVFGAVPRFPNGKLDRDTAKQRVADAVRAATS